MQPEATLPARYEPLRCLGAGGGGEVWSVRDRIDGRVLALKVLAAGSTLDKDTQHEVAALVREATTLLDLSSSTGIALPRVERFGRLADGRPFLVRELVEGESLQGHIDRGGDLLFAAHALHAVAVQLTQLHRAGLLHGDIKPANIIVRPGGDGSSATLVDLGLATAWGPGGARPEGLTPRYAAPELFEGEALTVRGEVYALGASLRDVLDGCAPPLSRVGSSPDSKGEVDVIVALRDIERRATARDPSQRHPSVDELGAVIGAACGFAEPSAAARGIWTIVATDAPLAELLAGVETMAIGEELSVTGLAGSGGRTLLAALSWRLAIAGWPIAWLRGEWSEEDLAMELATALGEPTATPEAFGRQAGVIIVDDPTCGDARLEELRRVGARVVARRLDDVARSPSFALSGLDARDAFELVRRALPSLPDAVLSRIVLRGEGRPGRLRAIVDAIGDRAIVRAESVDVIVLHIDSDGDAKNEELPTEQRIRDLVEAGRIAEAEAALAHLEPGPQGPRTDLLRVWIAHAKADYDTARSLLQNIEIPPDDVPLLAEHGMLRAKLELRAGAYDRAIEEADRTLALPDIQVVAPAAAAETLQARGLSKVYRRDDAAAIRDLELAVRLSRTLGNRRIEALSHNSLALAHQRAGRPDAARAAYGDAIAAAEAAGDASAVATARVNLGTLAWHDGDLARAIDEFEAAADLARRAMRLSTLERALINLAIVDLGLGRWARVATTLKSLETLETQITVVGKAQLTGLRADLAARTGDSAQAIELYRDTIRAWREIGRPQDAAEAMIDDVVVRRQRGVTLVSPEEDQRALDQAEKDLGARAAELAGWLSFARGLVRWVKGDEPGALAELEKAATHAEAQGAKEWRWQIHAARARVLAAQGSHARARRDADEAAAILEDIASKLPRDLREVFWDEPRRRALRQVNQQTVHSMVPPAPSSGQATALSPGSGFQGSSALAVSSGGATQFVRLAEDRLARILGINRDLAGEVDLERLLARVTDQAIELLSADRGFVLLEGEENDPTSLTARAARDRRKDDPSVQFSRSIAERVFSSGEPIVTNDARSDSRLGEAASVHALSIHSVACVPIPRVRGADRAPIGVLYLETRGARRIGTRGMETELPTLLAFADQVGIAIANAKLVDENRRRADELAKANVELEAARAKLDEQLERRTEQLERVRADLGVARQALRGHTGYAGYKGLVGASNPMRRLYALVDRVKSTDVPVLITGESGTGKEVVARAIHAGSERAKKPFLGVNCGAIPANLLESELFGHVKGAFTGADRDRKGLFREAEGGTILLDEIGEMPLKMQAGLLRVLQEKTVRPVGSAREEPIDARVICATHRDLEDLITRGEFREDLYYRINVVALRVPALRERAEDLAILCDHFLGVFAAHYRREKKTLSRDAVRRLAEYHWPGNVRQLENLLLNAFVLSEGSQIELEDLAIPDAGPRASGSLPPPQPPARGGERGERAPAAASAPSAEDDKPPPTYAAHRQSEKERILGALEKAGWNRLQAAKLCGIPRRTFYRRLKEYGIQE